MLLNATIVSLSFIDIWPKNIGKSKNIIKVKVAISLLNSFLDNLYVPITVKRDIKKLVRWNTSNSNFFGNSCKIKADKVL